MMRAGKSGCLRVPLHETRNKTHHKKELISGWNFISVNGQLLMSIYMADAIYIWDRFNLGLRDRDEIPSRDEMNSLMHKLL